MQITVDQAGYGIVILVLAAICLLSMAALITFSRSIWKLRGSREEWGMAIGLDPSAMLFWNGEFKERTEDTEREDRKRKDYYHRMRDRWPHC